MSNDDDQVCGQNLRASEMMGWDRFLNHGKESANLEMHSTPLIATSEFIHHLLIVLS